MRTPIDVTDENLPQFFEMGLQLAYRSKTGRRMTRRVSVRVAAGYWLEKPVLWILPADKTAARYLPEDMRLYAWSSEPQRMRELGAALLKATGAARGA